ncbi:MAG TPA: hypothetical protein VNM92_18290 [Thermoanaerobaculia bacterium]|nr:hypothetical protein [Thermoanaerobaculia bacterium]
MKPTNGLVVVAVLSSFISMIGPASIAEANPERAKQGVQRASKTRSGTSRAAKIFRKDLGLLKDGTDVPILLPGELLAKVAESKIRITSASSDDSGYEIKLATGQECGNACFIGSFYATPDDGHAFKENADSHVVRLARGTMGYFRPRVCGASCTPPSIAWLSGKRAYFIQFNVRGASPSAQKANMIRMASSAIEGGPR